MKGYSLIEVILVISIFFILIGLATMNLFKAQHTSQLSSTVNSFLADYKEQQIKAMIGDTEGIGAVSDYGVHFESASYTLFRSTYGTNNFPVSLPVSLQFSTTFPGSQILFLRGSGQISGFISGQNTITLRDTADGTQKIITINKYGVVRTVN
ncbi:MAG TPA: type II secretion system protein [Candidatus Sulfotelmatobacter sp.]|jgi:type II secretory pathway pseudopilin PulG|nr:type II secretion system protein [Candidatus Sulfotelmatobacter sp.]